MNENSNTFFETLKASFFLDFNKESFQLEQKLNNYIGMWILAGILLLTIIYLPYIGILFGIFYFLLQNKIENFKPLNLFRNLTYSFVTIFVYFFILFLLKVVWMILLTFLDMYSGWDVLGDIIFSFIWLTISHTIWYILMSIHINFKESKIRILLSQIFIIISSIGVFLFSFLITGGILN